jgi:hypothetical protein
LLEELAFTHEKKWCENMMLRSRETESVTLKTEAVISFKTWENSSTKYTSEHILPPVSFAELHICVVSD